jgi:hypothetical protein
MIESRRRKLFDPLAESLSRSRCRSKSRGIRVTHSTARGSYLELGGEARYHRPPLSSPIHQMEVSGSSLRSDSPEFNLSRQQYFESFQPSDR